MIFEGCAACVVHAQKACRNGFQRILLILDWGGWTGKIKHPVYLERIPLGHVGFDKFESLFSLKMGYVTQTSRLKVI
jgi:hypothetical protein